MDGVVSRWRLCGIPAVLISQHTAVSACIVEPAAEDRVAVRITSTQGNVTVSRSGLDDVGDAAQEKEKQCGKRNQLSERWHIIPPK